MAHDKPPAKDLDAPGLAGGPGPTPPGVDDGTPQPTLGTAPEPAQPAEEQGDAARGAGIQRRHDPAERSPGGRRRGAPQEREDPEPGAGASRTRGGRRARREPEE